MQQAEIDVVRRFNRVVTARVGALDDHYLSRRRPLGQSRVLWEIGAADVAEGTEVGVLRARLGIDSAQLSRTLRTLEDDGLLQVRAHPADARVRVAGLTARGRREWRALEAGSVEAARGILEPLSDAQRQRLVEAMADLERLLLASTVQIAPRDPGDPAARACLRAYLAEIEQRFGETFDSGGGDELLVAPHGLLLVAVLAGEPVGCGGLKFHDDGPPEIKRLWTAPAARGMGLGRRVLAMLESAASEAGARRIRLDTHDTLTEAMALYRASGYVEIPRYNDNPHAQHWFEKRLPATRPKAKIGARNVSSPVRRQT